MTVDHTSHHRSFPYRCFQNYYHAHQNLGLSPLYYPGVCPNVVHWQLRDMVQVDASTGKLYYATDDTLSYLDLTLKPDDLGGVSSGTALALDYIPKCFHQADGGYIVTGGLVTFTSNSNPGRVRTASFTTLSPDKLQSLSCANYAGSTAGSVGSDGSAAGSAPSGSTENPGSPGSGSISSSGTCERASQSYVEDLVFGGIASTASARPIQSMMPYSLRGSKGILSFSSPESGETLTVALGELINNAVTIYKNSNRSCTLYVCNNDLNLYVVDIDNSRQLTLDRKINCELNTALNNVVRCPASNKILTVTGDSPSIFLVDPCSSTSNSRIATIKTQHDSGFGISYHPNGTTFATAFQDGTCLVYDIRNLPRADQAGTGALLEYRSTRPGNPNGAFRCCKFSQTGINDMLAISEHMGRVHLVDISRAAPENASVLGAEELTRQVIVVPFALDQYGSFKKEVLTQREGSAKEGMHYRIPVYDAMDWGEETDDGAGEVYRDCGFPAPLVYDYSYLAKDNPNLFKNYSYQSSDHAEHGRFKSEYYHKADVPVAHATWGNSDVYEYYDTSHARALAGYGSEYNSYHDTVVSHASHINGEVDIAGIDWCGEKLVIGCKDGGVLTWDMNRQGRSSMGGFAFV